MKKASFIAAGSAAGILAVFLALVWSAGAQKSETFDEGMLTICTGAAQVRHVEPNIAISGSPLMRWVAGIPAVVLGGAQLPSGVPWTPTGAMKLAGDRQQSTFDWARDLFYHPGNDHDRVLFWGRLPFALIAALLGWILFVSLRRPLGDGPALLALGVFCFTPDVLAQAEFAVTDVASALTLLLVALALARLLESPRWQDDLLLGAALGLAMLVKTTAGLVVPFAAVLVLALAPVPPGRRRFAWAWLRLVRCAGAAWFIVVAGHLPNPRLFPPHFFLLGDIAHLVGAGPDGLSTRIVRALLTWAPLPDSFLKGLVWRRLLSLDGQLGYFHGQVDWRGWWYYFPAAVFLKYPTPLLLTGLAGLVLTCRTTTMSLGRRLALTLTPLVMFAGAMTQSVNIGVRSVIFIAPFLALWTAVLFRAATIRTKARLAASGGVMALAALSIASGVAMWPNFLTYFNPLMGGTRAADRWLVDSNLDWGQDLPALKRALDRRGIREVRLHYFGAAQPAHWDIHGLDPRVIAPGWYAISRSALAGFWPRGDPYAWLRAIPPAELVGGSIALIEVSPEAAARALKTKAEAGELGSLMSAAIDARYRRNDAAGALSLLDAILTRRPDHYGALYQRAAALEALGRREEARRFLDVAVKTGDRPTQAHARERIGVLARHASSKTPGR